MYNRVCKDIPRTVPYILVISRPIQGITGDTGPDAWVCMYLLHGVHGGVQLLPFGQLLLPPATQSTGVLREEQQQKAFPWGGLQPDTVMEERFSPGFDYTSSLTLLARTHTHTRPSPTLYFRLSSLPLCVTVFTILNGNPASLMGQE